MSVLNSEYVEISSWILHVFKILLHNVADNYTRKSRKLHSQFAMSKDFKSILCNLIRVNITVILGTITSKDEWPACLNRYMHKGQ